MPTCPRPPAPITTAVLPAGSASRLDTIAWYGVSPASVSETLSTGSRSPSGTRCRTSSTIMYSASAPGAPSPGGRDAQLRGPRAVVLSALGARKAQPAAPRPVDGRRLAHLDAGDALTQRVHDARALVPEGERQPVDVLLLRQAHDERVGVAQSRRGDPQPDLPRAGVRGGDLDHLRLAADGPVLHRTHARSSVAGMSHTDPRVPLRSAGGRQIAPTTPSPPLIRSERPAERGQPS